MDATSQALAGNFAVVTLFISAWVHSQFIFAASPRAVRDAAFGVLIGLGSVATMMLAVRTDNMLIDLRSSLIALAGFFGGPVAAIVAASMAAAYRIAVGGPLAWAGVLGITVAGLAGWSVSRATRGRIPAIWSAGILAVSVACIGPALNMLLRIFGVVAGAPSLAVALFNAVATALWAFFIMRQRVIERERDLLYAAFMQSPDFQYVKDVRSRFLAVNTAVAKYHGYGDPRSMVGKTDFDLAEPERAEILMREEAAVIGGQPLWGRVETLTESNGIHWYSSSKVPLRSPDGETIGLAGVTRDITKQKLLEAEVLEGRNQLNYVLTEMSDGVAMFNRDRILVYCNEQYRQMFPLTAHMRRPGVDLRDILREAARTGEELLAPGADVEAWIERVVEGTMAPTERELELADGRWLSLRARVTSDGGLLTVLADVTQLKKSESALRQMTEQLKLLATTDGLTGLLNRRAFDSALETELARAKRENAPLSLVMIDVDRFKAYNDIYGHPAGDEVLKQVGAMLREVIRRPGDLVARYGGEEFAAILPNTDEDGAFFIADAFREGLHTLGLPHKGSEKGFMTASIGLTCLTPSDEGVNANELVRRADEALYNAKGAGRDRVMGWRARHEVRPVGGLRA
jgi:diguanylate cyclase (GGDEF)-like protein/PAS domain S-box-containing protein